MRSSSFVVERDSDTRLFVGHVPGWPGAHSQGESQDELQRNLQEVVSMLLEDGEPRLESKLVGVQIIKVALWATCPPSRLGNGRATPGSSVGGVEQGDAADDIVYGQDDGRPGKYEHVQFDFPGYTFQPRLAENRWGKFFVSFLPAIGTKAAKAIRRTIRGWRMSGSLNHQRLEDLARLVNSLVRGWLSDYGRFYRSRCVQVLRHLDEALAAWVRRKFKRFRRRERASVQWLSRVARREPDLFVRWQLGGRPAAGV